MSTKGNKILDFISRLVQSDTPESSKRFIALIMTTLIAFVVIGFTNHENMLLVLGELIFFVSTLVWIAKRGDKADIPKILKNQKRDSDDAQR